METTTQTTRMAMYHYEGSVDSGRRDRVGVHIFDIVSGTFVTADHYTEEQVIEKLKASFGVWSHTGEPKKVKVYMIQKLTTEIAYKKANGRYRRGTKDVRVIL